VLCHEAFLREPVLDSVDPSARNRHADLGDPWLLPRAAPRGSVHERELKQLLLPPRPLRSPPGCCPDEVLLVGPDISSGLDSASNYPVAGVKGSGPADCRASSRRRVVKDWQIPSSTLRAAPRRSWRCRTVAGLRVIRALPGDLRQPALHLQTSGYRCVVLPVDGYNGPSVLEDSA
jgi:hypothetical protein